MALKRLTIQAKKSLPGFYSSDNSESQPAHEQSAMAFKRFTVHARKSLPGLYPSNNTEDQQPSNDKAVEVPSKDQKENQDHGLVDFGSNRCGSSTAKKSPIKDSPSMRKRLLGSMRRIGSLRNLQSPTKTLQSGDPSAHTHTETEPPYTPTRSITPSLTLNFEQTPPDPLVFELRTRRRSISSCSQEVLHSSPVPVPGSASNTTPFSVRSFSPGLPDGTLPESPAPLQVALDKDATDSSSLRSVPPTPMLDFSANAPMPTPMPGTNLSLEDVNPAIVVHSPPVASTAPQIAHELPGYFDIPHDGHTSVSHGIAINSNGDTTTAMGEPSRIEGSDPGDSKHAPTPEQLIIPSLPTQAPKASAVECTGAIVPRIYTRTDKQQSSESSGETGSYDYQILRYRRASGIVAERRIFLPSDCEPRHETRGDFDADDCDYTAWDSKSSTTVASGSNDLQRCRSTWSRHTGLYDGTGYGDDSPLTSEPGSPVDAGTNDLRGQHERRSFWKQPASSTNEYKLVGVSTAHSEVQDRDADITPKPKSAA